MLSVQVNLRTITKNVAAIKKQLRPPTRFCAVVKANAYGFGMVRISKLLEPIVDCFAVANLDEGIALRQAGIQKDILVFGVTHDVPTACQHNLIITLNSLSEAEQIVKNGWQPRLHLAVNTGMNRFGISSIHEFRATLQLLAHARVEGCYTHLAYETDQRAQVDLALERFKKFVTIAKKYFPGALIHAGCSGVIDYPPAHFDMLRIGKALYGGTAGTRTALTIKSTIVAVKKIKPGATVGYNGEYTAPAPMVVGIVHGGYAHGIHMNFSGTNFVTVDQQACQIIGRVCMDCFFIDVTHVNKPLGKSVTIISPRANQNLLAVARQSHLIPCNILQSIRH